MGVGGTPEGVISAAAIKCLGGALQGRLWPRDDDERRRLEDAGYDVARVLTHDDLRSWEGRVRRRHRGHERRAPPRRADERSGHRDGLAGDAVSLGNGAAHRGLPSFGKVPRLRKESADGGA